MKSSVYHRAARRSALNRLQGIQSFRVVIRDSYGTTIVGQGNEEFHLEVNDQDFWGRLVWGGPLSVFDEYLRGSWSSPHLLPLLRAFVRDLEAMDQVGSGVARLRNWARRTRLFARRNSVAGSRRNIRDHYDLSNEFFALWLDPTMTYSAGIWSRPDSTLEEASIEKLDRICHKLGLRPGMRVVEIGTGWGSMAIHAAQRFGCQVTTTTISRAQADLARERIREAGQKHQVSVIEVDYRELEGQYDRLASIEMIEAVGHRYLGCFLSKCSSLLKPDGMALIQAITVPDARYDRMRHSEDFIKRHIFPGSCLLSVRRILDQLAKHSNLALLGHEDLAEDYARTLAAWRSNFKNVQEQVRQLGYGQRFIKLWDLYLAYCEAGFRERFLGLAQIQLGMPGFRDRSYRAPWPTLQNRTP